MGGVGTSKTSRDDRTNHRNLYGSYTGGVPELRRQGRQSYERVVCHCPETETEIIFQVKCSSGGNTRTDFMVV